MSLSAALAKIAEQPPCNQMAEVAGPDKQPMVWFIKAYLPHKDDQREVIADVSATCPASTSLSTASAVFQAFQMRKSTCKSIIFPPCCPWCALG